MKRLARALSLGLAIIALLQGCSFFRKGSDANLPVEQLYREGQTKLEREQFEEAREVFKKITQRYADTEYAPLARFLIGETYYREPEYDKAIKELEGFIAFYPGHRIADLVQYRLALSYYNQLKPVEQDQALTQKAVDQFKRLVKEYPESRYAPDALAKIDICRGRLAQKELWVANYYWTQGNLVAVRQRLELILKDFPRTLVVPETLFLLAEVHARQGLAEEATKTFRRLVEEYPYTEWGRRAAQRLNAAVRR